jgi:hypothetical protein
MIIGAQKSATTSIASIISKHEQVCFSKIKEPAFFSHHSNWQNKIKEYHSLFDATHKENGKIWGEGSPHYTLFPEFPDTAKRLYEYNPDLKLIYVMRHPVMRMVSQYGHNVTTNEVVFKDPFKEILSISSYTNRSRYHLQISQYLKYFKRNQILLLTFEEFKNKPQLVIDKICEFLKIDQLNIYKEVYHENKTVERNYNPWLVKKLVQATSYGGFNSKLSNFVPSSIKSIYKKNFTTPQISDYQMAILKELFYEDIKNVEKLMDRRISEWI